MVLVILLYSPHHKLPSAPVRRSRHDTAVACRHAEEGGIAVVNQEGEAVGGGSRMGHALQGMALAQGQDGVAGDLADGIETVADVEGIGDEAVGRDAAAGAAPVFGGEQAASGAQTQQCHSPCRREGTSGSVSKERLNWSSFTFSQAVRRREQQPANQQSSASQRTLSSLGYRLLGGVI